jgi:hypothetical protein
VARRRLRHLQRWDSIATVMATSFGLAVLTITLIRVVPTTFRPTLIGIASASLILGVIMEGVPLARRHLTFQEGVLARLGTTTSTRTTSLFSCAINAILSCATSVFPVPVGARPSTIPL